MSRGVVVLLVALVLLGGCTRNLHTMELWREFPHARSQSILTGQGTVGSFEYRPFLDSRTEHWEASEWLAAERDEVRFRFVVHHRLPLRLTLEGRSSLPKEVTIQLNEEILQKAQLKASPTLFTLELPEEGLRIGNNVLTIQGTTATQWHQCKIEPSSEERPRVEGESLKLPYYQTVEYPLVLPQAGLLKVQLSPWSQPGTAENSFVLEVRLGSDQGQQLFQLDGSGRQTLQLPPVQGPASLALTARPGPDPPLPGQLGISLEAPRIELSSPPAKAGPVVTESKEDFPNIIIYQVDTLRADRLGIYGYPRPTSPNIDTFARQAVLYTRAKAQSPWTKPSVASLLTGLDPRRHGVLDFGDVLADKLTTLPEILRVYGYQTAGITVNGLIARTFGYNQGFDVYDSLPVPFADASVVNECAFNWLGGIDRERPFFLFLHTLDPHNPYQAPQPALGEWLEHYFGDQVPDPGNAEENYPFDAFFTQRFEAERARGGRYTRVTRDLISALYDGEVAHVDACFGKLLDWLRQHDLYDNTLIIFVSDHGEELLDRTRTGHTTTLFEELVHIPLIVKYPHDQGLGTRVDRPWQHVDLMPMVLDMLEVKLPEGVERPSASPKRPIFMGVETGRDGLELSQGDNYLIHAEGVQVGDLKLVQFLADTVQVAPLALYDLAEDPGETVNLAESRPVTLLHLECLLKDHLQQASSTTDKADPAHTREVLKSLQYL